MYSDEPNPKDFQNYDDYLFALNLHNDFIQNVENIEKVLDECETEEEERIAMEKLGFICCEDYVCERPFCQKRGECLSVTLDILQSFMNEELFLDLLSDKDLIFSRNKDGYFDNINCDDLPKSWFDPNSEENKIINLYLDINDALIFNNLKNKAYFNIIKNKKTRQFVESLYFLLQMALKNKNHPDFSRHKSIIRGFLKDNDVLDKNLCEGFLLGLDQRGEKFDF